VTAADIQKAFLEEGVELTDRTIRRYLTDLTVIYPIHCDDRTKPHTYCWAKGTTPVLPPSLDPQMALAFKLLQTHAAQILPAVTLQHLQRYFEHADKALANRSDALQRWPEKIRVTPAGLQLEPQPVDPEVHGVVYRAVFEERQFEAVYQNAKNRELKTHVVHPRALVDRGRRRYLLCNLGSGTKVLPLALWRIQSARLLDEPRAELPGFDVDAFIRGGNLGVQVSAEFLELRFRVRKEAGAYLHDLRLSADQAIVEDGADWLVVSAKVADTQELRAWLHGFADEVEVLGPPKLREEFAMKTRATAGRYELTARRRIAPLASTRWRCCAWPTRGTRSTTSSTRRASTAAGGLPTSARTSRISISEFPGCPRP